MYNQQIIDTSTDILCITSAYKWTNTGYLNRFRCVFCFCLSSCSHTGSLHSVQLFVVFFIFFALLEFLFSYWTFAPFTLFFFPAHLFSYRFSVVFSEHLFSYLKFEWFLAAFCRAGVPRLYACIVFRWLTPKGDPMKTTDKSSLTNHIT